jgi:hypothetical protein
VVGLVFLDRKRALSLIRGDDETIKEMFEFKNCSYLKFAQFRKCLILRRKK